mmetsp:Transcript_105706/g.328295  ORF Transcript_105706/g.328295 Transcript_105706/m.328295 type:complete len:303 (-) Transcript_105706:107-1015(-)
MAPHCTRLAIFCLTCRTVCWAHAGPGIRIIGAGLPRTGTQSLKFALNALGYRTSHALNASSRQVWCDWLARGKSFEPALRTIADSNATATLDQPASLAYKELLRRYPQAKVILTVRDDADQWYRSFVQNEVHNWDSVCYHPHVCNRLLLKLHPYSEILGGQSVEAHLECARIQAVQYGCDGVYSDHTALSTRSQCTLGYQRHQDEVRRWVPAAQLLVFNVRDGWAPLCDFLQVPVPSSPFPQIDFTRLASSPFVQSPCRLLIVAVLPHFASAALCLTCCCICGFGVQRQHHRNKPLAAFKSD